MMSLATVYSNSDTKELDILWGTLPGGAYDYNQLTLGSLTVNVQELKTNINGLIADIKIKMDAVSFGLTSRKSIMISGLYDSPSDKSLGYSFLSDPRNQLDANQSELASLIISRQDLSFFFTKQKDWNCAALFQWLSNSEDLLALLTSAIQLTSGMPARSTELVTALVTNTLVESRHLYILHHSIAMILNYNKSRNMTGKEKVIPRFLSTEVSTLLLQYLVYIRPFEMYGFLFYSV